MTDPDPRLAAELARWTTTVRRFVHDLRNPLTVIKTNVAFLRERPPEELAEEAPPVLEDLAKATLQAEELVAELGRLARGDGDQG